MKERKNNVVEGFRIGDEFDQGFDELIAKGFIARVGTDESDSEPKYVLTEKAKDILELMDFVKVTDAILKEHGRK